VGETPAQSTHAGCKASQVISAKEVAVQWRKPIADRDSGIWVELTLIYPPFGNPANLETESYLRGLGNWPDEKRDVFGVCFHRGLGDGFLTASPNGVMARSQAAAATETTAGDSRRSSGTPNHEWRGRHCRPSAWQPRDCTKRVIVSRLTEGCADDRTSPRSTRVEVLRDPGAG